MNSVTGILKQNAMVYFKTVFYYLKILKKTMKILNIDDNGTKIQTECLQITSLRLRRNNICRYQLRIPAGEVFMVLLSHTGRTLGAAPSYRLQ